MKQTAQDAPGTTIQPWGDLRVSLISGSRMVNEVFKASTGMERFRDITEGVDAAVTVDAQNAPTATWNTADSFPQAPTPIMLFFEEERRANNTISTRP